MGKGRAVVWGKPHGEMVKLDALVVGETPWGNGETMVYLEWWRWWHRGETMVYLKQVFISTNWWLLVMVVNDSLVPSTAQA